MTAALLGSAEGLQPMPLLHRTQAQIEGLLDVPSLRVNNSLGEEASSHSC
jgi:hypothetical protein